MLSAQDVASASAGLKSKSVEDRRTALYRLRVIGTAEASRAAVPALRDKNETVRAEAANTVVHLPPEEALETLKPLLSDRAPFVRREAATAFGKSAGVLGLPALEQRIKAEKKEEVRPALAMAVGDIGKIEGLPALASLLVNKPSDSNEFTRRSACRAIGRIAQMVRAGRIDLTTPQSFLPDRFKDDLAADDRPDMSAFGPIGRRLLEILASPKESPDTRREAVYALGVIGDPSFESVLTPIVNSDDPYLAEAAKEAVRRLYLKR